MDAAQIRAAAMAMLASVEPEPEPEPVQPEISVYEWAMLTAEEVDDPLAAWHLVASTWDGLDGNQTLALVGVLMGHFAADVLGVEPEPEPELTVVVEGVPDVSIMRAALMELGYDPAQVAVMDDVAVRMTYQTILETAQVFPSEETGRVFPSEPVLTSSWDDLELTVETPAPRLPLRKVAPAAAAKQSPAAPPADSGSRAPRGMRRRVPEEQRAKPELTTRQQELQARREQARMMAANGTPDVGPLKAAAPRTRSEHQIPPGLQQWKRDAAGRRVPIDQPADPA